MSPTTMAARFGALNLHEKLCVIYNIGRYGTAIPIIAMYVPMIALSASKTRNVSAYTGSYQDLTAPYHFPALLITFACLVTSIAGPFAIRRHDGKWSEHSAGLGLIFNPVLIALELFAGVWAALKEKTATCQTFTNQAGTASKCFKNLIISPFVFVIVAYMLGMYILNVGLAVYTVKTENRAAKRERNQIEMSHDTVLHIPAPIEDDRDLEKN